MIPTLPTTRHELGLLYRARPAMAGLLLAGTAAQRWPGTGSPVRRVPGIGWVTADPVVARTVLRDHRSFTILGEGGVGNLWAQILGDWVLDLFDGAGHHDLRSRTRELFTETVSRDLVSAAWDDRVAAAADELRSGGTLDVAHLSRVLVGRMVISLLGIPRPAGHGGSWPDDEGALRIFETGERLASVALGTAGSTILTPAQVATAQGIVAELNAGIPDGWRNAPPDTLLGRCRELGLGLTETSGLASLLMVAGTETAASAMGRITALLIDTGEQHRMLAALRARAGAAVPVPAAGPAGGDERAARLLNPGEGDPVENVVREGLRVTSPASVIGRGVAADVEVGGARLRGGERIMLLVWSANAAAGPFRADRPYLRESRQLWFGAGRHLCLGAALARAEIGALLRMLWEEDRPLHVVRRRAARGVLIPAWSELIVSRT
ncbi:cytochrome P450 [Promicromonospora iranensis]|uniref:Cytochrome P450 n=1 Tax=Promicromonospora iranensis TaxID=1105144 RepID=A0ABU2CSJ2_9MICO|nr:cytochrome P450 [Promicromonospora iranensis]MDR7384285.1 cytochrome P450 [Promicromonospora iranensis]